MESNPVFYLKYRPQTLSELIGQESVKQTISKTFMGNRLSHAYLFVGPRGTGKTSAARILAKMVNCEKVSNQIPCNKCATCVSITDGSNLDLIEIDAASNRGIDDIRSLREKVKLAPTNAKKKVYIIDEVHMLTAEAFNALLKTLEEPPSHVLFILATTESNKIPQTILSRCQRLDFHLATPNHLREVLEKIIKTEKIDIEEEALSLLIRKADGSFRDGVKMLDYMASKDRNIKTEDVLVSLRSTSFENMEVLIKNFSERNVSQSLMEVEKLKENGTDMKEVISQLLDLLRNIMLIRLGLGEVLVKSCFTQDKYESLAGIAQRFENEDLIKALKYLQQALEQLKFASISQLPLELAVLEICGVENQKSQLREVESENKVVMDKSALKHRSIDNDTSDLSKIKEKWTFVLETIRPYNFSLEALLRSVRINAITDVNVIMEVPYSFHQRILEAPKNRDILEGIFSDILGRSVKVSCVLGTRPVQKDDIENIEIAQDDEIIKIASEIFNSDSVN